MRALFSPPSIVGNHRFSMWERSTVSNRDFSLWEALYFPSTFPPRSTGKKSVESLTFASLSPKPTKLIMIIRILDQYLRSYYYLVGDNA